MRARRHSRQGDRWGGLRAGPASARHGARARGAAAELRRTSRRRGYRSCRKRMPGVIKVVRDGDFLAVVARARVPGGEGDATRWRQPRAGTKNAICRSRTSCLPMLMKLPAQDTAILDQRRPPAGGAEDSGGDLHPTLSGARVDRSLLRSCAIRGRRNDGVDAHPGRLPRPAGDRGDAAHADRAGAVHPYGRALAVTGTTAPTTRRRRGSDCARAARAGPFACSGCASRSTAGSLTVPRW